MYPRAPVDASDLTVGRTVEALDINGVWYPATITAASPDAVTVHFIGWDREWDMKIERADYARHLCKFRGWGESVPGDYRLGETVEAMDLTAEWVTAKVIAVAESMVKVHYKGWRPKWDEWIDKSSGRLHRGKQRAQHAPAPSDAQPSDARRGKHARQHDLRQNDDVCSVCHAVGELVCCEGRCRRAFHQPCLAPLLEDAGAAPLAQAPAEPPPKRAARDGAPRGGRHSARGGEEPGGRPPTGADTLSGGAVDEEPPAADDEPWVCPDCTRGRSRCVLCGECDEPADAAAARADEPPAPDEAGAPGGAGARGRHGGARGAAGGARKCARASCTRHFHAACLERGWQLYGPSCEAASEALARFECMAHVCCECGEAENNKYGQAMALCTGCGTGFHRACLPPRSAALELITLGTGLCLECSRAKPLASRGGAGARASHDARRRGLAPFRFAPPPPARGRRATAADSGESDEAEDAPPRARARAATTNHELLELSRASSEIAFPWEPLSLRRAGGARAAGATEFALPASIVEELRGGRCDASTGFKPREYVHITRSVWLAPRECVGPGGAHDAAEPCSCAALDLGCDEGCFNRSVRAECSAATCSVGPDCSNRRIQRHMCAPISVFKTLNKGWGVRADSPIRAGSLVVEYVGEVIDAAEWRRRNRGMTKYCPMYFMHLSRDLVVDARLKGNASRFINHSCEPNIEVQKWFVSGSPRLAMFALRDIAPGEELAYNYRVEWTGEWAGGQRCRCEAPNCTGGFSAPDRKASAGVGLKPIGGSRRPKGGASFEQGSAISAQLARLLAQPCRQCRRNDDAEATLLCDGCDQAVHLYCLRPPLEAVPDGDWFCEGCRSGGAGKRTGTAAPAATPSTDGADASGGSASGAMGMLRGLLSGRQAPSSGRIVADDGLR